MSNNVTRKLAESDLSPVGAFPDVDHGEVEAMIELYAARSLAVKFIGEQFTKRTIYVYPENIAENGISIPDGLVVSVCISYVRDIDVNGVPSGCEELA